jgi:chromosome partitioning protein
MVVRRAVTLGLPVILVGQEADQEDNVAQDYRDAVTELINHPI